VHPSWRDLVIDALARDGVARRRFLGCCGVDGAALALSGAGGPYGARRLPLLVDDADWDALGDGLHRLCAELEEPEAVRLCAVLEGVETSAEVQALRALVLERLCLRWHGQPVGVDALAAGLALAACLPAVPDEAPVAAPTWMELMPPAAPATPQELERFADWLRLAELLHRYDDRMLARLEFPARHWDVLRAFAAGAPEQEPVLERELRVETLRRLGRLVPALNLNASAMLERLRFLEDPSPPVPDPWRTEEPPVLETRFAVDRVLRDLIE
jgi:hypothetical protein